MRRDINGPEGWDGTYKNEKLPTGVYIYSIEVELLSGKKHLFSGSVTLVR